MLRKKGELSCASEKRQADEPLAAGVDGGVTWPAGRLWPPESWPPGGGGSGEPASASGFASTLGYPDPSPVSRVSSGLDLFRY